MAGYLNVQVREQKIAPSPTFNNNTVLVHSKVLNTYHFYPEAILHVSQIV